MQLPFFIALRYFFSKSKQTIVNLINLISVGVVLVAAAALFIVLSAFSGLKTFGLSFSNAFDPDVRVEAVLGKRLVVDSIQLAKINALEGVSLASPILEDKVFLTYRDKSQVGLLKGVEGNYNQVIKIDSLMVSGNWFANAFDEVIIGGGLARNLSLGVYDYSDFLQLAAPKRKGSVGLGQNPLKNETAVVAGIYFANEEIDKKYLFAKIDLAQRLFQRKENEYTYIEIKANENPNLGFLEKEITSILGQEVTVLNRVQLNKALYKMLNTENVAVYLIFSLIIIIALFNVVGALIMMFLDKKPQLNILFAMGLTPKQIQRVFFYLGGLISWVGGGLGFLVGAVLVVLQQAFPFLYIPGTSLPYPVEFDLQNAGLVIITVFGLGAIASAWATRNIDKKIDMA